MRTKAITMVGKTYNRLTVLDIVGVNKHHKTILKCKCSCGNIVMVVSSALLNGNTKSCGCLAKEMLSARNTTHGANHNRLYNIWCGMISRTTNKNVHNYNRYGGRGIKVCDEWRSFIPFRDWSYDNGYNDDLSIDRVDNDGNYCPENCQWITMEENSYKRRRIDRSCYTSKYFGVYWCNTSNRWIAHPYYNKKLWYAGQFKSEEHANVAVKIFLAVKDAQRIAGLVA